MENNPFLALQHPWLILAFVLVALAFIPQSRYHRRLVSRPIRRIGLVLLIAIVGFFAYSQLK